MTDTLQKSAGSTPVADWWEPVSIGPRFDWVGRDFIRIADGRLEGQSFKLTTEVHSDRAACYLQAGDQRVGQCLIERDPPGEGIVLWEIGVRPELRQGGLCAVMTWVMLRELITIQPAFSFRVRMITSVRTGKDVGLQNVGICVVAARLGLSSDLRPEKVLAPENLVDVRAILGAEGEPPGMVATVKHAPLTVIGFLLDPDTFRPVETARVYQEIERNPQLALDWAKQGQFIISNGDWSLRAAGVERFLCAVALDADEAAALRQRVRPLA